MRKRLLKFKKSRRGVIAVLAAVLLVLLLGMIAFAVDIGYLSLAKTQLQSAADSSALAAAAVSYKDRATVRQVAQTYASYNYAAGRPVQLNANDIEFGSWDAASRTFTPSDTIGSAIKVTTRTNANSGGATPLFFARIFGKTSVDQSASAIATVNPRDIAFVVDLSRSMNFDTNPIEGGTPALIQNIYDDFNFGTYPGSSQYAGYPLLTQTESSSWLSNLKTKLTGNSYKGTAYFTGTKKGSTYYDSDGKTVLSDATRTKRAYSWVMEVQLPGASLMPNLIPRPNASITANYNYWKSYIDSYPSNLGYLSYVTLMMNSARDYTVPTSGGSHTPLSLSSELCPCPEHTWTVTGESFSFPPREMPTHAARRALIAALQVVRDRNASISDVNQKDWVSLITFDSANSRAIKLSLTDDYSKAMQMCTRFQACGGTGTEGGLDLAYNHIKPQSQGGAGRENTNKIVVLLTDGQPNDKRDSVTSTSITSYMNNNTSTWLNPDTGQTANNWVTTGQDIVYKNAALMQTSKMQSENWFVYAAGIGGACDYDFMDRVARMGATANTDGQCPRGSDDPNIYENVLRQIFENIITNPKLRLVK